MIQCALIIVFIASFITDIIVSGESTEKGKHSLGLSQILCGCIVGLLSIHEIRQIWAEGISYFSSFWNYFDLSWIGIYAFYMIIIAASSAHETDPGFVE